MDKILEQVSAIGLVPVIASVNGIEDAVPLGRALVAGGIPLAEVTFRMPKAEEIIATMVNNLPDCLVGAGTVTSKQQVDLELAAGAKFIVAPGLNKGVVHHCQDKGVPIIPGIATPSELDKASELGLKLV